jgi:hypothetical protein
VKLVDCLQDSTIVTLKAIAQNHGLQFRTRIRKAELVDLLADRLLQPRLLKRALRKMGDQAKEALHALLQQDGQVDASSFAHRFGPIRSFSPWFTILQVKPWLYPASPAEELFYLGLIFKVMLTVDDLSTEFIIIPEDVLPLLPQPEQKALAQMLEATAQPLHTHQDDLLHDAFAFLSFLNRQEARPIWGHWLTQNQMRQLDQRLAVKIGTATPGRPPEAADVPRSERRATRLSFIHYLCHRAQLIALTGPFLKPTPLAYEWLEAPSRQKMAVFLKVWREESEANRQLYGRHRLPGWRQEHPIALLNRLLNHLGQLRAGDWHPFAHFVGALEQVDSDLFRPTDDYQTLAALSSESRADFQAEITAWVEEIIAGPLHWLGVVSVGYDGEMYPVDPLSPTAFALTMQGVDLLNPSATPPAEPAPAPFTVHPDLRITVPSHPRLVHLLRLEEFATPADLSGSDFASTYQLTEESVLRSLEQETSVQAILTFLEEASGEALPLPVTEQLHQWAQERERVTIRQVTLLQTKDLKLLEELASSRAIREHIMETLSPRTVTIDGSQVKTLVRKLRRLGLHPKVEMPMGETQVDSSSQGDLDLAQIAYLLMAALAYAELGGLIELPVPVPHSLLTDLESRLDPHDRDAVKRGVEAILRRLRSLLQSTEAVPEYGEAFPSEELLPLLEKAIAEQTPLQIEYLTQGRRMTSRVIEPLRLEWRGGAPYLIAYCRLRRDQRVFRLDRIQNVSLL